MAALATQKVLTEKLIQKAKKEANIGNVFPIQSTGSLTELDNNTTEENAAVYIFSWMWCEMNSEECRLRTFEVWYNIGPMSSRMLAANGFFATGNLFEVECNWCHCRLNVCTDNENIEQRHLSMNPYCDFVIRKHDCGNIPLPREQNSSKIDLLTEKDRLATFVNWPNPNITPEALAKAGFFYLDRSDEVQCAWCKGVIAQWEKQDNAFDEHRRFFPDCPRVQLGPLIEIANDGIRDLGIQQITQPKNPKYSSLHARLQTYLNWPIPEIQKPEDLVQAGLYYQQVDDQVKCFHCNMGLRSWEKQDDPWFEHAKWYPMCEFVRLVKGVNYIKQVQELSRSAHNSNNTISCSVTIEEAMLMEPIKQALNLGLNAEKLRSTTQNKILETGRPYESLEELLDAIFNVQSDVNTCLEGDIQTSDEYHQCSVSNTNTAGIENISSIDTARSNPSMENVLNCTSSSTSNSKINFKNSNEMKINLIEQNTSNSSDAMNSDRQYLEEENRKLKDARLCKVCLDEEVGVVYLPCGHLVTCVQCAPGVNQCPLCRTKIKGFVRTYLS